LACALHNTYTRATDQNLIEKGYVVTNSPIVDCHLHVYWPEKYPYPEGPGAKPKPGEIIADLNAMNKVMSANKITHALLVQPSAYETENKSMIDVITTSKGRVKGIAAADVAMTDDDLAQLKRDGIVGVRLNLYSFANDIFEQPGINDFLKRCAKNDIIAEVFATPATWPKVIDKLRACPARMVFEHMGWPKVEDGVKQEGFQLLLGLAKEKDCSVKLSCAFRMSKSGFPFPELQPYVDKLLEVFGPERCMWGSDWPMLRSGHDRPYNYAEEFAALERWVPNAADRRAILWSAPAKIFGFTAN